MYSETASSADSASASAALPSWPTAANLEKMPSALPLRTMRGLPFHEQQHAPVPGPSSDASNMSSWEDAENLELRASVDMSLSQKLREALYLLVDEGELLGCQVCVLRHGVEVVSECAGVLGPIDPRPVRPDSLFCAFGVSKGVIAAAVNGLVDQNLLQYDNPLSDQWVEFGVNDKR